MSTQETFDHTVDVYLSRGWRLLPGVAYQEDGETAWTKRPTIRDWSRRATNDRSQLEAWMSAPLATGAHRLLGMHVGWSSCLVLDIDRHGANGWETLQSEVLDPLGMSVEDLARCAWQMSTPSGGGHFIVPLRPLSAAMSLVSCLQSHRKVGFLTGVDLLVGSSFLVLPPSTTGVGAYVAVNDGPTEEMSSPLASRILELVNERRIRERAEHGIAPGSDATLGDDEWYIEHGIPEGERDTTLMRIARRAFSRNMSTAEVELLVEQIAERSGFEEWEPRVRSAERYHQEERERFAAWKAVLL